MIKALYYKQLNNQMVQCTLCPHYCLIKPTEAGLCQTRRNEFGELIPLSYGKIAVMAIDPIEKKPLHQWHSGENIMSIGGWGCNMTCVFCQNHDLSMGQPKMLDRSAQQIIRTTQESGLDLLAFTYNEPFINYEMVLETCQLARTQNIKTVLVTNGYINEEPFANLAPWVDAMNIDVKATDSTKYKEFCGGSLEPVLRTIQLAVKAGIQVELTFLIVPEINDDLEGLEQIFNEVRNTSGDLYIHISRYFPRFHYDKPATPITTMLEIQKRALKYFTYAKLGNV